MHVFVRVYHHTYIYTNLNLFGQNWGSPDQFWCLVRQAHIPGESLQEDEITYQRHKAGVAPLQGEGAILLHASQGSSITVSTDAVRHRQAACAGKIPHSLAQTIWLF